MALVPAFLGLRKTVYARSPKPFRAGRDPDLVSTDVRPPRAGPGDAAPSGGVEDALKASPPPAPDPIPPAPSAPAAYEVPAAPKPRKRSGLGRAPELISAHRKLSDHVGLWRVCRARVCRRARSCVGPEAVACLYDHRAIVQPLLPELSRLVRKIHPDD